MLLQSDCSAHLPHLQPYAANTPCRLQSDGCRSKAQEPLPTRPPVARQAHVSTKSHNNTTIQLYMIARCRQTCFGIASMIITHPP